VAGVNTGHDGSMSTIHANTTRDAVSRIENMVQMGSLGLPSQAIRSQIASSVDLIIQVERHRDGGRRITQVTDVCGLENDIILMNDLFYFELRGEGADGRLVGEYRISRMPPSFQERLVYFGVDRAWAAAMAGAAS
jgi:pilus assembly protein CpaF